MEPTDNIQKLINEKSVQFRDFKNLKLETRKSGETEELVIEGIACTFNEPTVLFECDGVEYKEQIDDRAFDETDMTDVIFNFNHCGRVYARTRNGSLNLEVKEDGLHMRAILMKDDEGHAQLYRDIQSGLIDKMSFAFTVQEQAYDRENHMSTVRRIKKLFDVSAVDIPAYDTTTISARSFFESERQKELEEIKKRDAEIELAKARFFYI